MFAKVMIFDGDEYSVDIQLTVKRAIKLCPVKTEKWDPALVIRESISIRFIRSSEAIVAQADKVEPVTRPGRLTKQEQP